MSRRRAKLPPYFDSQVAAAARLGLPIELLKAAKAAGCGCFRSGRVHTPGLRRWLREHGGQLQPRRGGRALRDDFVAEQIRRLQIANDRLERESIPRSEGLARQLAFQGAVLPKLERILCDDYAALVVGLDTPGIRLKGKQVVDQILQVLREASGCWEGW